MRVKNITIIFSFLILLGLMGGYFLGSFENDAGKSKLNEEKRSDVSGFHYSSFSQKDFFDSAFEKTIRPQISKNQHIRGIIIPHHLLASNLIANALYSISSEKPITVVIISPNHFFTGQGQIISSLYDWETPYGILESDKNIIKRLQANRLLDIDELPFEKEHGISNLTAFIKKVLPNAKIIPLIIKDTLSFRESDFFLDNINKILPENTLFIASLDFSHYLPSQIADFHDTKSLAVLASFDYEGINFLDIDSKPSLRIFLKYLASKGANAFNLLDHSNSAYILKDENISETTSYITGFFSLGNQSKNEQTTLLAFGDLMLDRYIRKITDKNGKDYPFQNIKRFLIGNDLTLANLEGSFTDFQPKPLDPDNTTFTFNPNLIPVLKKIGFNIFNLANNHSLDFGKDGLIKSQKYLEDNNIDYFGDPSNKDRISVIKNIRGIKIGFVGYNEFNNSDFHKIIEEIKKIKQEASFVVVYTHWGTEYQTNFSETQQEKAHQFIDAGADVILGSHPHVIQPVEVYKNRIIFYSLGNFLFDQTFSQKVRQGLGVGIVFDKIKLDYYLFPTETKGFQVNLLGKEKGDIILNELADQSLAPEDIKKQIIKGKITINF
ncbi:MAG: AmmeMemoRadiSam system protein B [Candidatus Tagabacteria bacterium RIFCSPLOWO2_01_FULL_39_11]|uniref:AmmeMemoRadiSam system protein B n=1 Tax=Candidatus Tagabacteria bacterium RIFCSPLOWO2_01_FULL_39_11 TaxID=1802295 RepID=A0A1G2LP36_9BACT|nr:MAG: AmmeMemoRadiSam system protein B [Candidatus Tagabacteria bacterium RIFCSPLOWO2_01_FULL_39_11]